MISPQVIKEHGTWFRHVAHIPMNCCARCGYVDDPETAKRWAQDMDGDSLCPTCEAKENTMGWISTDDFPLEHPRLQSLQEGQDSDPYVPLPDDPIARVKAELDRRKAQRPITVERRRKVA